MNVHVCVNCIQYLIEALLIAMIPIPCSFVCVSIAFNIPLKGFYLQWYQFYGHVYTYIYVFAVFVLFL